MNLEVFNTRHVFPMNHWDGEDCGFPSFTELTGHAELPLQSQHKRAPTSSMPWKLQNGLCSCFKGTAGEEEGRKFVFFFFPQEICWAFAANARCISNFPDTEICYHYFFVVLHWQNSENVTSYKYLLSQHETQVLTSPWQKAMTGYKSD